MLSLSSQAEKKFFEGKLKLNTLLQLPPLQLHRFEFFQSLGLIWWFFA